MAIQWIGNPESKPKVPASPASIPIPCVLQIFGYPTGLGALLIHKSAASHLRKVYFGGGSVDYCTAEDAWAVMSAAPAGGSGGSNHVLAMIASTCVRYTHQLGNTSLAVPGCTGQHNTA
jgi:hypothetical protein